MSGDLDDRTKWFNIKEEDKENALPPIKVGYPGKLGRAGCFTKWADQKVETYPISKKLVKNNICVSDIHAGCMFGLCPPTGVFLDNGAPYLPSKAQQVVWDWWLEFWFEWVPLVTKNEAFTVVINGDWVDGRHHGAVSQISQNLATQNKIGLACIEQIYQLPGFAGLYSVRGTEAHTGQSGENEEVLAKQAEAIPDELGNYSRHDLWLKVGDALCHYLHHIGTSGSSAHEASAVNAEMTAEYVEAARWGHQPPDFVIRSHRHRSIVVDLDGAKGYAAGIVTPGWQLKTPFTFKIAGARMQQPQFGGILIRTGDQEHYYRRWVKSIGRSKTEEPSA